ncbi:hypothetical protein GCM10023147_07700 [Tsukamurella soli]|uniref:Peptidase M13 N-terminal domain-containing protein n=1 Tax=Tsukamurella soli TaxID=644556 RepID=A0ABP8J6H0_9ACTN
MNVHVSRRGFLAGVGGTVGLGLLAACGVPAPSTAPSTSATPAALIGADLSGVDDAVSLRTSLFRHVNGAWLERFTIPADKSGYDTFTELADRTLDQLHELVERISDPRPRGDAAKIRDIYDSFMDAAAIDAAGIGPVSDLLAIDGADSRAALTKTVGASSVREWVPWSAGASGPTRRTPRATC